MLGLACGVISGGLRGSCRGELRKKDEWVLVDGRICVNGDIGRDVIV